MTILERLQEKYPVKAAGARNIAEALGMINGTGEKGFGAIADVLYKDVAMTFDPNGGSGVVFTQISVAFAEGLYFPSCPFTPPVGKVFDYWCTESSGTDNERLKKYPGYNAGSNNSDATYYAIWKDLFTVSFNANGGEGEIDDILVPDGQSIETLPDGSGLTAPEGKVFGGWATTDSALVADVTAPYTPADDTTLYAFWDDEPEPEPEES